MATFSTDAEHEYHELERALGKLDDCVELSDWDREFVDDLCRRVIDRGVKVFLTPKQWAQLERMKDKYLD